MSLCPRADADGKDALLVCDTKEMADALNRRIHDDTIAAAAPTVTAARGQRIAVGDVIISRRNDPTLGVLRRHRHRQAGRPGAQRPPLGIVKLFENICGAVDVSGLGCGTY
jgi:hypothetical protein